MPVKYVGKSVFGALEIDPHVSDANKAARIASTDSPVGTDTKACSLPLINIMPAVTRQHHAQGLVRVTILHQ